MIDWSQLALPILLSAVAVFFASTMIHVGIKWHNADYKKLPNEDEVSAAIRRGSPPAAQYIFPHCKEGPEKNSPEMKAKFAAGPVGVMWLRTPHEIKIGPFLGKWFGYVLVVSALTAYLARSTLVPGAPYLSVFRVVGATAWLAYAWQGPADSIWMGKPWSSTFKYLVDGLIYASLTAGVFGWLWPR
jgi:hypothetical protein